MFLRWLILFVNLTGPWGAQIFGQMWFGYFCEGVLDELYILIGRVMQIALPNVDRTHPLSWRPLSWLEQEG